MEYFKLDGTKVALSIPDYLTVVTSIDEIDVLMAIATKICQKSVKL